MASLGSLPVIVVAIAASGNLPLLPWVSSVPIRTSVGRSNNPLGSFPGKLFGSVFALIRSNGPSITGRKPNAIASNNAVLPAALTPITAVTSGSSDRLSRSKQRKFSISTRVSFIDLNSLALMLAMIAAWVQEALCG
nr:hypothetical protein [uncultured Thiodictyon sp.]